MRKTKGNLHSDPAEANYIDKIIKENCANLVPVVLRKLFRVQYDRMENLPEIKVQVTLEKEPDFLRVVYNSDYPDGVILHLEFETGDYEYMDARMLFYLGFLYRKWRKPVLQFVLYFGEGTAKMNSAVHFGDLAYRFRVISIENFSYKEFTQSDIPEEVILGLLADKEDLTYEQVLELVLKRLQYLKKNDYEVSKFTNQLIMLSRLRNLQILTMQKVRNMGIKFDVNQDILFLEGLEKGVEKERKKKEREIQKGAIRRVLFFSKKVNNARTIAEYAFVDLKLVKKIQKEALLKDKILAELKKKNATPESIAEKLKVDVLLAEIFAEQEEKKNKK